MTDLTDLFALLTIIIWPVVPLFWIPVHGLPKLFRKLGIAAYLVPLALWIPVAYVIWQNRELMLRFQVELPALMNVSGLVLFILGLGLQLWTIRLLTMPGIMGVPEVRPKVKGRLVTTGAFAVVRHPTYLSHTIMCAGVFFFTEVIAVGIILIVDFLVVRAVIIPLEDRELTERFGEEYRAYQSHVPAFLPSLRKDR